ncbi:unnamed protein product [Absidia cylindrospora]
MDHRVKLLEMDCPAGYVGRLSRSDTFYFPRSTIEFSTFYVAIIKLVWLGRRRMEQTLELINSDKQTIPVRGIRSTSNHTTSNKHYSAVIPSHLTSRRRRKKNEG